MMDSEILKQSFLPAGRGGLRPGVNPPVGGDDITEVMHRIQEFCCIAQQGMIKNKHEIYKDI